MIYTMAQPISYILYTGMYSYSTRVVGPAAVERRRDDQVRGQHFPMRTKAALWQPIVRHSFPQSAAAAAAAVGQATARTVRSSQKAGSLSYHDHDSTSSSQSASVYSARR